MNLSQTFAGAACFLAVEPSGFVHLQALVLAGGSLRPMVWLLQCQT